MFECLFVNQTWTPGGRDVSRLASDFLIFLLLIKTNINVDSRMSLALSNCPHLSVKSQLTSRNVVVSSTLTDMQGTFTWSTNLQFEVISPEIYTVVERGQMPGPSVYDNSLITKSSGFFLIDKLTNIRTEHNLLKLANLLCCEWCSRWFCELHWPSGIRTNMTRSTTKNAIVLATNANMDVDGRQPISYDHSRGRILQVRERIEKRCDG